MNRMPIQLRYLLDYYNFFYRWTMRIFLICIGFFFIDSTEVSANTFSSIQNVEEIVFIDSAVEDAQILIDAVRPGIDIHLLDSRQEGIEQVSKILLSYRNLRSIHIVSHGAPGVLQLGSSRLDSERLLECEKKIHSWRSSLRDDAEILLYGCEIGAGRAGREFVDNLAKFTGAAVAASIDPTGGGINGGNWVLELGSESISTPIALYGEGIYAYKSKLRLVNNGGSGTISFTVGTDGSLANTTTPNGIVSVIDLLGTGFDFIGLNGTSTLTHIKKTASLGTGCVGSFIRMSGTTGTIQYLEIRANQGIFDLQSLNVTTFNSQTNFYFEFQALDSSFSPIGAPVSLGPINSDTWSQVSLTSFPQFTGIGGFRIIPPLNGTDVSVDEIEVFNPRNANSSPSISTNTGLTLSEGATATISNTQLRVTDAEQGTASLTYTVGTAPDNGTLRKSGSPLSSGSTFTQVDIDSNLITYVHNGSETTSDSFTFTVSDGVGGSIGNTTFNFTIDPVNDAPTVSAPGSISVMEDVASVLTGISFADADAGANSVTVTFTVGSGALSATPSGGVSVGGTATALTLTGSIAAINDFIVASNLTFTTALNNTDSVTLGINMNDGGYTGSGGALSSGITNVTLNVTAVNDTPTVSDIADQSTNEDTATSAISFTVGDVETSAGLLTLSGNSSNVTLVPIDNIVFDGSGASRAVTVTPAANRYGSTTISITVSDGDRFVSDTFTLTVIPVVDTPSVIGASTNEDTQSTTGLVILRHANDGDEITHFKITEITGGALFHNDGTTSINNGTFIDSAQGGAGLKFTPTANSTSNGSFTVQASSSNSDAGLGGSTVTAAITVFAVNDAPVLNDMAATLSEINEDAGSPSGTVGTPISSLVSLGGIVTDADTGAVTGIAITAAHTTNGTWFYTVNNGINWIALGAVSDISARLLAADANTRLYFQPNSNFNGTIGNAINFRAWDQTAGTNGGFGDTRNTGGANAYSVFADTASIKVNADNDEPVITSGSTFNVVENTTEVGTVTSSDSDSTVSYSIIGGVDSVLFTLNNTSGALAFALAPNFEAPADANADNQYIVQVQATDGSLTASQTLTVTVTNVNEAPTDITLSATSIAENQSTGTTLGAFSTSDVDSSDTFTYTFVSGTGDTGNAFFSIDGNSLKTASTFDYEAQSSYSIRVRTSDLGGLWFEETFTVTVTNVNEAPIIDQGAGPLTVTMSEDGSPTAWIAPALSATEVDAGQTLTWSVSSNPSSGTANVSGIGVSPTAFTYAPNVHFHGSDTFTVQVSDGSRTDTIVVNVTIQSVNDAPVITEGDTVNVNMSEDGAPIAFSQTLNATDFDNDTLSWNIGASALHGTASVSGTGPTKAIAYAPDLNYFGSDSFSVQVNDGNSGIDTITVNVTIASVNDAPTMGIISDPAALLEDTSQQTINLSGIGAGGGESQTLTVTATSDNTALILDPTVTYTSPNATGSLTFTPLPNANGTATITVTVMDNGGSTNGGVNTVTRAFTVTVTAVNDAPAFTSGSTFSVAENTTAVGTVTANDLDGSVTYSIIGGADSALFILNSASGVLAFISAPNYETPEDANADNQYEVQVQVSDGELPAMQTIAVTVTNINEAPTNIALSASSILENRASGSTVGSFSSTDVDANDTFVYTLVSGIGDTDNASFTLAGNILKTAASFNYEAKNSYNIRVRVTDSNGSGLAYEKAFTITVTDVNEAPTLTSIANPAAINEDAGQQTVNLFGITAGSEESQSLTVSALSDNTTLIPHPTVSYISSNSFGSLSYTPVANANGTAVITVTVTDDGGTDNGGINFVSRAFTVGVNAVNDEPSFIKGANQTVVEDGGAQSVNGWATSISPGPADESTQALTFLVSNDNSNLFSAQPAISNAGTLTYTPATNANGTATVTVALQDSGGTANGGDDLSSTQMFNITVEEVNDKPVVTTTASALGYVENEGEREIDSGLTLSDIDDTHLIGATVQITGNFQAGEDILSVTDTNDYQLEWDATTGTLSIAGSDTLDHYQALLRSVTYCNLSDNPHTNTRTLTFTVDDGLDRSASANRAIEITVVNDTPTLNAITNPAAINEDASLQTINLSGIGAGGGESQTLTVTATSDNTALIPDPTVIYTTPNTTGSLTYTPLPNVSGAAMITVTVMDDGGNNNGGVSATTRTFAVTVNTVNDTPTLAIISNPAAIDEDAPQQTVNFSGIGDGDPDQTQTLTITVSSNNIALIPHPTVSYSSPNGNGSLTYTPVTNANGTATITVTISDDGGSANGGTNTFSRSFTVTVNAVNDAPTIASGSTFSVAENTKAVGSVAAIDRESALTYSMIGGVDQAVFTLNSASGALSFASAPNYEAPADANADNQYEVQVQASDGELTAAQTLIVTVTDINEAPTDIALSALTVLENQSSGTTVGTFSSADIDADDTFAYALVSGIGDTDNASFTLSSDRLKTAASFNYEAKNIYNIRVRATDRNGSGLAYEKAFTITVIDINEAPTLTAIADPAAIDEDAGPQTVNLFGITAGEGESQMLAVSVSSNNTDLIPNPTIGYTSPNESGALFYTPVANANGTAVITVTVSDDGGTANGGVSAQSRSFTVRVNAVNDAPSFVKGADQTVNEDAGEQSVAGWATALSKGPSDESAQTLTFGVSNDNPGLFFTQPAVSRSGTLTYTPVLNAHGTATVTVSLQDNGGTANGGDDSSTSQNFLITVLPVNDVPSFTKGADIVVNEDSGAQSVAGWAANISAGPMNEATQALLFHVTNNNGGLFVTPPAIRSDGTLTFTTAPNASGSANVSVTLQDDGGIALGGSDTTMSQSFTFTVSAINDAPTVAINSGLSVNEGASEIMGSTQLRIEDIEQAAAYLVISLVTMPVNGTLMKAGEALSVTSTFTQDDIDNNLIAYNHSGNETTSDVFVFAVSDGSGGTIGDSTFAIAVVSVNDAPLMTVNTDLVLNESAAANLSLTHLRVTDAEQAASDLTYTVDTPPSHGILSKSGSVISANGTFTQDDVNHNLITYAHDGSETVDDVFTFSVSDGVGGFISPSIFHFSINPVNDPPHFVTASESTATEDLPYSYSIVTDDNDSDLMNLSLSVVEKPTWLNFALTGSGTGTLSGLPTNDQVGTYRVTLRISDGSAETEQSFTLIVVNTNDAPYFTSTPITTVQEGQVYVYNISAGDSDPGMNALTITAFNKPAWLTLTDNGNGTATLTGTPGASHTGSYSVYLWVQDGQALADQLFTIHVASMPTLTPTVTSTVTPTLTATATATFSPTASPTSTDTATPTQIPTLSPTATSTPSVTVTSTPSVTQSPTATLTVTPIITSTATPTFAPLPSATANPTSTPSVTPTPTSVYEIVIDWNQTDFGAPLTDILDIHLYVQEQEGLETGGLNRIGNYFYLGRTADGNATSFTWRENAPRVAPQFTAGPNRDLDYNFQIWIIVWDGEDGIFQGPYTQFRVNGMSQGATPTAILTSTPTRTPTTTVTSSIIPEPTVTPTISSAFYTQSDDGILLTWNRADLPVDPARLVDIHVYLRTDFGERIEGLNEINGYYYLGRTGSGADDSFVWRRDLPHIASVFQNGPERRRAYEFQLWGLLLNPDDLTVSFTGPWQTFQIQDLPPNLIPTATPTAYPTAPPLPAPALLVLDSTQSLTDLSSSLDFDPVGQESLTVCWNLEGSCVNSEAVWDAHVYVCVDGGDYVYLGRTGMQEDHLLEWRKGALNIAGAFRSGPAAGHTYKFQVYYLLEESGTVIDGPYENEGAVGLLHSISVTDDRDCLTDLCGEIDEDFATERALTVRWQFPTELVNPAEVQEYHVYVKLDDGVYTYLGRALPGADLFVWKEKGVNTSPAFRSGPQYGYTYRFRVYALTATKPYKRIETLEGVQFLETAPLPTATPNEVLPPTPTVTPTPSVTPSPRT